MDWYVAWVTENLLLSAFIQFLVLGTAGELAGILAAGKRPDSRALPWLLKALVWGILGIFVKYAFTGFTGFQDALVGHSMLPKAFREIPFLQALSVSCFMNAMFGPFLMFTHRFTDNLISGTKGFEGIEKSLKTLAWFWIPAHTVTFLLPPAFRIGLAALWSVALGLIMGFFKRSR